jgi:alkylation response protein AidB-like acyl-CoA dehydrogenase
VDFRFDDEQLALRDAIGALCQRHFPLDAIRAREGAPIADAAWHALADLGVFALLGPGEPGGVIEAVIVFEQLGAHIASGPYRWTTLAAPLLADAMGGAVRVTGVDDPESAPLVVAHPDESDEVVVVQGDGIVSCAAAALADPAHGIPLDPLTPAAAYAQLPACEPIGTAPDAAEVRRTGTILTAAELVGAAQGALDVATAYALERHQFGVPIGSFQAVKHMLADMYVRVELARSATYAAAAIGADAHHDVDEVANAAGIAKLLAGEAGIANGRAAVQVLGGMGFTWEMLPHYFLKRAWLLEELFGTADTHAFALSEQVAAWT